MTNDAAFFLFFLLLLVEVIITVVAALNVIKQLKDHIDYKFDYNFDCMKTYIRDIVDDQFERGLDQIEDANRALCEDVKCKIASVNHIDSKVIYNVLKENHERFTSFANHLGKKHDELISLIKPKDKPEEVMVSLGEVIETISKMKKEK